MRPADKLDAVLRETAEGLRDIFGNRLDNVLLYGSYARGDQDGESDIDVMALVDMPRAELQRYRRTVSDFSSEIDLRHGVLLSIHLQDTENYRAYANLLPFFQNVAKEGVSLVR